MTSPEPGHLTALSDALAQAVETAAASIVRVEARRGLAASGVAVAVDLVLTADHVVDPAREKAGDIVVGLPDGQTAGAKVAGRDPATDLAVLRVEAAALAPASAATQEPRTGMLGLVVARPGGAPMASLAVVSGAGGPTRTRRGGMLERYLLVDAVMYPGFSGGALVGPTGEVLGLATSALAGNGPDIAIPWAIATRLGAVLAERGRVSRGYLGIGSQPVHLAEAARSAAGGAERGLLVVHVAEGGPAATAGILQGDILVSLDGHPVSSADDLQAMLGPERVGTTITAGVVRGGAAQQVSITVGTRE